MFKKDKKKDNKKIVEVKVEKPVVEIKKAEVVKPKPKPAALQPLVFNLVQGQDQKATDDFFETLNSAGYKVEKLGALFSGNNVCTITFKITKG